jgi:RNA polymerase sigma-70 factor (ECF subfamily)
MWAMESSASGGGYQERGRPGEEPAAELFERHRPLLFSIAYRMLASVVEAEDAVQEAYLRYRSAGVTEIESPRAYLCTVVTRICLNQLKSARAQRETYIGTWLPEPLLTDERAIVPSPEGAVEQDESISVAFLVLLERLSPLERAVFLLHEVFEYGYEEVATIVGRSEAACRQLFHRARAHIVEGRPRFQYSKDEYERLAYGFLTAARTGDIDGLKRVLADDVIFWTDSGGQRPAARQPVYGSDRVARYVLGVLAKGIVAKAPPEAFTVEVREVNGRPGFLIWLESEPIEVVTFDVRDGLISGMQAVLNPQKLSHLTRPD